MSSEELRDIKELAEITDYSLEILSGGVLLGILLLILIVVLIKRFLKNKKQNHKQLAFERLKNLDTKNSKEFAYNVTMLGRIILGEAKNNHIFEELLIALEKYKYKKESKELTLEDLQKYRAFLESINGIL